MAALRRATCGAFSIGLHNLRLRRSLTQVGLYLAQLHTPWALLEIWSGAMLYRLVLMLLILAISAGARAQNARIFEDLFKLGNELYARNDFDGAIAYFTRVIEAISYQGKHLRPRGNNRSSDSGTSLSPSVGVNVIDPRLAVVYAYRGSAHFAKGEINAAISDYDRAISINPRFAGAYNDRGIARHAKRDLNGALADFDQSIRLSPAVAESYNNRGNVYSEMGDLRGAIADFDHAIKINPHLADAYCNRGNSLRDSGDIDGAIRDFDVAIELNPRLAWAYYGRGLSQLKRERINLALADFTHAIEFNPRSALAYMNRGLALRRQGRSLEAVEDFKRCVLLDPGLRIWIEPFISLQDKK
jgi:tetratricopeptide (TPR) repeat protein